MLLALSTWLTAPAAAVPPPAALLDAAPLGEWHTESAGQLHAHFPADTVVDDPEAWLARRLAAFERAQAFFRAEIPRPVHLFVYNDDAQAMPVTGRPLGFAIPADLAVHTAHGQTPGHELAHVVAGWAVESAARGRFVGEGLAVAFDDTGRDRLAQAREAVRATGAVSFSVLDLWASEGAAPESVLYPVAGAFVGWLVERGGRDRFLELLELPWPERAETIYGDDLARWAAEFDEAVMADVAVDGKVPPSTLRAHQRRARRAMIAEVERLGVAAANRIAALYHTRGDGRTAALQQLVDEHPQSNRAGCALVYLAREAKTDRARERLLKRASDDHSEAWYGDGTQVGPWAKALLAAHWSRTGKRARAERLAEEIARKHPHAVRHGGWSLVHDLRKEGLIPD